MSSCAHKWKDYRHGQQVCGKCGQVRNGRQVRGVSRLFHTHSYPVGRPGSVVNCACGHAKRLS